MIFLDGKPMKLDEIVAKIQAEKSAEPNAQFQALVAADKETPHGFVVGLIDAVRRQGITDLAINVEKSGM